MSRFKLNYIVLFLAVLLVFFTVPTNAQDTDTSEAIAIDLNSAMGNIGIHDEFVVSAEVELVIGDQTYRLDVPVTLNIDTDALLADAKHSVSLNSQVGVLTIEPVSKLKVEATYEKNYRSVSPGSPDNVVVVFQVNVTNLHDETLDAGYSSVLKTTAIDSVGNVYDEEERICGDIDPGETILCEFIFDVPITAELSDLEVETAAFRRFSFGDDMESE